MNQSEAQLGTVAFNHLKRTQKVASLTTAQLDRRLKHGEVQRRFTRYSERGLPSGDGQFIKCSESEALEAAISDVFIADQRTRDKHPYRAYCGPAHIARIKRFINGASDNLQIDAFVPDTMGLAKVLRETKDEEALVRLLAAEMAGRNPTGEKRESVMDAIYARLAAMRTKPDAPALSDEEKAALIADDSDA